MECWELGFHPVAITPCSRLLLKTQSYLVPKADRLWGLLWSTKSTLTGRISGKWRGPVLSSAGMQMLGTDLGPRPLSYGAPPRRTFARSLLARNQWTEILTQLDKSRLSTGIIADQPTRPEPSHLGGWESRQTQGAKGTKLLLLTLCDYSCHCSLQQNKSTVCVEERELEWPIIHKYFSFLLPPPLGWSHTINPFHRGTVFLFSNLLIR